MCIINLTNSKRIDQFIDTYGKSLTHSPRYFSFFIFSKVIQPIIVVKQKYAFVIAYVKSDQLNYCLLKSMDAINNLSILDAIDRLEEFILQEKY